MTKKELKFLMGDADKNTYYISVVNNKLRIRFYTSRAALNFIRSSLYNKFKLISDEYNFPQIFEEI